MGEVAPVVAGMAIGIAFVIAFSVFGSLAFGGSASTKIERIDMAVDGLKDTYRIGEPMSFTISASGVSNNLCNHPKPHVWIGSVDDGETVWSSPATFSRAMGCINSQAFELEWRFGYPGEELPYPSAIGYQPYDNNIIIEKAGLYRMTIEFEDFVIEREFSVSDSNEVISLHKGCFGLCHRHSIFIFGNGTTIHREYGQEGDKIYIFQVPANETSVLFRQFYEADLSMPKTNRIFGTDIIPYQMTFTAADGKTTKIFYREIPSTPQIILDLDLQIEQLVERYDDRVVDCTDLTIRDCPVHEPNLDDDESDAETGLIVPEDDSMGVGEPIEIFEVNDNDTKILIEYEED